ncbi:MAG: hypothetical protein U0768_10600 [Anaerolineae bacterium]
MKSSPLPRSSVAHPAYPPRFRRVAQVAARMGLLLLAAAALAWVALAATPGHPTPGAAAASLPSETPSATATTTPTPTATPPLTPMTPATRIPTATPELDLTIDKIEVTQAIQCLDAAMGDKECADNSLPLVQGKATILRVYPRGHLLSGSYPGAPVHAVVTTSGPDAPLAPLNGAITVDHTPQRRVSGDTWNFRLPSAWTMRDSLTLHVEINDDRAVAEINYANNSADVPLTFNARNPITVRYVPLRTEGQARAASLPSARIDAAQTPAARLFPVADTGIRYLRGATLPYRHPLETSSDAARLIADLDRLYWESRLMGSGVAADQLVAWLPAMPSFSVEGQSDASWYQAWGQGRTAFAQDTAVGAQTLAREMAHNLGRHDASRPDGCGAADPDTDWPYPDARIQEDGFDPFANEGRGAVVNALTHRDLMTYCADPWISPFTYRKLYAANGRPPTPDARDVAGVGQENVLVTGALYRTGGGSLDALWRLTSGQPAPLPAPGQDYCVEQQDGGGRPLQQQCFNASFAGWQGEPLDQTSFFVVLPFAPTAQRIVLKQGGAVVAARAASEHPPRVFITDPAPGQVWDGVQTITWQAQDADADSLLSTLFYSADDGASWWPLAADVAGSSLTVDTRELPGGNDAQLRILTSDGFDTAVGQIASLNVPRKAPRVTILAPADGDHVRQEQPVSLTGAGDDPQDGALAGDRLTWSSDRDGVLGTGEALDVRSLSPGDHTITLTARDSDGVQSTASLRLYVQAWQSYLPLVMRGLTGPTPRPTSTPRPTRTPTETMTPTETPVPTNTPTATATLTPTPTATATATATLTLAPPPTATATATAGATRTPPPTETPVLGVRVRGYVRVGSDTGPGLAGVSLHVYLGGEAPGPVVATTDAGGFYMSEFLYIPGQAIVNLWAEKDGYTFYPPLISWRHYYGAEDVAYDFVATPGGGTTPTPTVTWTPTVTPTPLAVTVDRAWTADTANAERMAFKAGEAMRMCVQVTNRGSAPLTAPYSWTVVGENGSPVATLSGSDRPTFAVGQTTSCRDGVVPAGVTWQQYQFTGTLAAATSVSGSSVMVFAGKLLVNETFTSPASGWPVANNASYAVGYVNGEYQILVKQAGLSLGWSGPGTKTGDMVVELDGRRTDDVNDQYGVMLGLSDDRTQWVAFHVTQDGAFQVVQWVGLDQSQLYPMTASPALRLGTTPNHLMAMRQGANVRVYANGQELARVTVPGLPSPATQGLASQSWVANGDTRYDNFRMYSLTTAE